MALTVEIEFIRLNAPGALMQNATGTDGKKTGSRYVRVVSEEGLQVEVWTERSEMKQLEEIKRF